MDGWGGLGAVRGCGGGRTDGENSLGTFKNDGDRQGHSKNVCSLEDTEGSFHKDGCRGAKPVTSTVA